MQHLKTVLIATITAIIVTFVWNMFLQVPPQFTQGVSQGYQQGYIDSAKMINESIEKNKVKGTFTADENGKFYLLVE